MLIIMTGLDNVVRAANVRLHHVNGVFNPSTTFV